MKARTYRVMPAPGNGSFARHWMLAVDGCRLGDELYRGEALDLALRLANSDWSTRQMPACVLFADEHGVTRLVEAQGRID